MPVNSPRTLTDMLDLAIERYGSLAFVTDVRTGNTYTYLDLLRNAKRISAQIASHGITPGSRIAFLTKNDTVFFPLLFACARCGVTLIPLNRELPTRDLESLLEHAQVSFVFIDKTGEYFNLQGITIEWNRNNNNYEYENTFVNEEAMVIYTSGTSGFAKGVILTHQNLINMAHVFVDFYNLAPAQRFISMLPYYHINAPMITGLVCVASGAHVYVTELFGRTHIDSVLSLIETYKINILSATPSIIAMLLRQARDRLPKACRSLDFCFCGTAALPESTWRDFENTVGVPIYQGYGLTETTTWATMTPRNGPRRYNTVGIPVASKIKIEGSPPGEVLVKGPIVMKGYLNDPGLTEKSFSDEWYRTGDLGYIDSDGHLILSGRAKNIIKRRGVLVYPNAVDEVIRRSGFVEDTCTFGIPDELAGEKIVSACVLRHGTLNDVRKHLTENLARQTRPDELHEVGVIAQNEMGKPAVDIVRDIVSGNLARKLIATFDRYEYRKAQSPDIDEIREQVDRAIRHGSPVQFVGFWGVGTRTALADPDIQALGRLGHLLKRLNEVVEGVPTNVSMMLWLADVHGRGNGISDIGMDQYFKEVTALAASYKIETQRLSEIWLRAEIPADAADILQRAPKVQDMWERFPLQEDLIRQANTRCQCPENPELCAFRYYCTRLAENPALARMFEGCIQFTYSRPTHIDLLPKLPTLFWHSTKAGRSAMPWFS